ncbi:MAG: Cof-type HAD-IIB family hydrolase [Clostridiales Family XIII bacterium]|jgi:Cof subfamily protein (haloacid dehalogenase superfamily)|nr:Cof-type HAD-IIB family hydrolase [Clostridiales Family XIII bacterium]
MPPPAPQHSIPKLPLAGADIRLVATDLDGTLLSPEMRVTVENRAALERCSARGIEIVVATGRSLRSIPDEVRSIHGLRWLVCANGAKIYDNDTFETVYADCLDPHAIESVWPLIQDTRLMKEVFWEGIPYTQAAAIEDPGRFGVPRTFHDYVRSTRMPVPDIAAFTEQHIAEIENINFIHRDEAHRVQLLHELAVNDGLYTLTTSLPFNYEIGGADTSKAHALAQLCERLGIERRQTLCIGDNNNDVSMLSFAGIGVAMGDASEAAKEAADFITLDCEEDGVAFAIQVLVE